MSLVTPLWAFPRGRRDFSSLYHLLYKIKKWPSIIKGLKESSFEGGSLQQQQKGSFQSTDNGYARHPQRSRSQARGVAKTHPMKNQNQQIKILL